MIRSEPTASSLLAEMERLRSKITDHPGDCVCDDCLKVLACEVVLARSNSFAPQTMEVTR